MSNRTNRTLSANTLGLNLGTRSLANQARVIHDTIETLRLRPAHPGVVARFGRITLDFAMPMPAIKRGMHDAKSPRQSSDSSSRSPWPAPSWSRGYCDVTQGQVVVTGVPPVQPAEPQADRPRRLARATAAVASAVAS